MPLLPFISVPSVLKLWAGWRSFFLLVEKTLQHIKKPSALSHSLLQDCIPTYRTLWSPSDHVRWWAGEKSACLDEGRGAFGWTAIKLSQNNECIIYINFGQTKRAVCDEVRANNRHWDYQRDERKQEVSFSPTSTAISQSHLPWEWQSLLNVCESLAAALIMCPFARSYVCSDCMQQRISTGLKKKEILQLCDMSLRPPYSTTFHH